MEIYYNKDGKQLGRAWGFSRCWGGYGKPAPENHNPHSHDPMYAMYGPYFCPGYPEVEVYDAPPRQPLNPQVKEKSEQGSTIKQ